MASYAQLEAQYLSLLAQRDALAAQYEAGNTSVLGDIQNLNSQIAAVLQQQEQLTGNRISAGSVVKDDQGGYSNGANSQDPSTGPLLLQNGRIQPPPDTTTGTNAIPPQSTDNNVDWGLASPTRPYSLTQSTTPGLGLRSPGPVYSVGSVVPTQSNGIVGPIYPSGALPGAGAAGEDQGTSGQGGANTVGGNGGGNPTVSELNAIDYGAITPQPNILDQYATYTYQASLYLMTPDVYQTMINTSNKSLLGNAPLLVQTGGSAANEKNDFFKNDYYIDQIDLKSSIVGKGVGLAHNVSDVKMTIIEPNGITFLDNLSSAVAQFLGGPKGEVNVAAQVYLLVIRFYGYDSQGNLVRGGVSTPNTTSDPNSFVEKWYPMQISNIAFKVQNKVVEYTIDASAIPYYVAAGSARGSLPFNMELSGQTLKDILGGPATYTSNQAAVTTGGNGPSATATNSPFVNTEGGAAVGFRLNTGRRTTNSASNQSEAETRRLQAANDAAAVVASAPAKADAIVSNKKTVRSGLMDALNQYQLDLVSQKIVDYPDEYQIEFVLDSLASAKITNPGSVNKNTTSMSTPGTAADQKLGTKQSMDSNSRVQGATAGMQIVQFIDTLVRNSSYIKDQQIISINEKTGVEERTNVKITNTSWYKIGFKVEPKYDQFDKKRNDYAYKITYTISPYKLSQLFSPYFNMPLQTGTHKQYRYWFTGQNDSVLSYEENFNYLYYIVMSGQNLSDRPANAVEYLKFQYQTASGQASQGADKRTNEPAANAADQLYSPTDLGQCTISIVGDPAWLQQGESFVSLSKNDTNYFKPFLQDGTINFDSQQILFEVGYNKPGDYNINTGLIETKWGTVSAQIQPLLSTRNTGVAQITRTYIATEVRSTFHRGKFTQTIHGSLMPYVKDIPNVDNASPTKTSTAAAPTKTTAPAWNQKNQQAAIANSTTSISSTAKGVQQILLPATQEDNPSLTQLQASPVYIQAKLGGATSAAALAAAKASFAAGTNNAANFAAPGIRTGTQLIVKDQ